MNKLFLAMLTFCFVGCFSVFASLQYEIVTTKNGTQNWNSSREITLNITEGGSLWLTSYVSNWYSIPDLGTVMNMTAGNYGYIDDAGNLVGSTGETKTITLESKNGTKSIDTTGYFVGNFDAGDEVNLWITDNTGSVGESVGTVNDGTTDLVSRQAKASDMAGNVRQNYSFGSGSIEFVAVGGEKSGETSGQPLPSAMLALVFGAGTVGLFGKKRKGKKQIVQ